MFAARVLTAIVGVPLILAMVWLGGLPFTLAAALVAALAAGEASRALGGTSGSSRVVLALPMLGAFALTALGALGSTEIVAGCGALLLIAVCLPLFSVPPETWTAQLAAILYVALPLSLFVALRTDPLGSAGVVLAGIPLSRGMARVLLVLTTVWAVDVVAYLVGRLIGRHQLWPRVSPKKTWEGTIAGLLAGVLVWLAWGPVVGLSPLLAGGLGTLTAGGAVIGDLAESALKRAAGLKDASTLLPGHGGLLDRLDSLGFATVIVFLYRILLGT